VFTPGGNELVINELTHGDVAIYDLRSGEEIGSLGVTRFLGGFQLSSAGSRIVTVDVPSRLYACDVCGSDAAVERAAQLLVPRKLTPQERRRFLVGT
jgi:hypothetical protein